MRHRRAVIGPGRRPGVSPARRETFPARCETFEARAMFAAATGRLPGELHVWAGATWTSDGLDRVVQPGDGVVGTRAAGGYRAGGAFGLAPTLTLGNDVEIAGTSDDALFRVQRQAYAMTFASPAANGEYVAIVEFAEPDAAAVVGSRVFDIAAEGRPFATRVDPVAIAGAPRAAAAVAGRVTVADGQFDLAFTATAGQAIVSGVTLVPTAIADATTASFDASNYPEVPRRVLGDSRLASLGRAVILYAADHRNAMPPDLGVLAAEADVPLAQFVDPRGPTRVPRGTLSDVEREAVARSLDDYVYVRSSKLPTRFAATTVIAYENPTRVAGDLSALYADGHVASVARAALGAAVGFDPALPPTSTAAPSPGLAQDPLIGQSRRNVNQLIAAMYTYSNDHRLALPPTLGTLAAEGYVTDLALFVDPRLAHVAPDATGWTSGQRYAWVNANADYDYRVPARANASNASPNAPLIFERADDLDAGRLTGGLVVGFGGGNSEYEEARWARQTLASVGAADPRMGVLMGSVFNDVDGDGTPQAAAAEPIVSGWTVYVDLDEDGVRDADEPSQTSVDGAGWRFDGLARGTYTVRVDATSGRRATRAAMAALTEAAPGAGGLLVGLHDDGQATTLTGLAFDDANANGTFDAGETGATYADVYADANGNGRLDAGEATSVPDASTGRFALRVPNPTGARATYAVRLALSANAVQLAPAADAALTVTADARGSYGVGTFAARRAAAPTPLAGTPIGTAGSIGGNTIAKAFDGSLATFVDLPGTASTWIGLDLGSAKTIASVKFTPRASLARRMTGGTFQASNSATFATGVVTLGTIAAQPAEGVLTTLTFAASTATYRYVRYVPPAGSFGNVAELQFFGAAGGTTPPPVVTPPVVTPPTAGTPTKLTGAAIGTAGAINGNGFAKALDNDLSTFVDSTTANGATVGLDLGTAKVIKQIKFAPRATLGRRMVGGYFQGSNASDFSVAATLFTIATAPPDGVLTSVDLTSATAYRYVRYVAPASSFGNVAEVQFYG